MADPQDGGPAFPVYAYLRGQDEHGISVTATPVGVGGMTLRDYFAARALHAVITARIASLQDTPGFTDMNQESIAEECYELADAMLAARVKRPEEAVS